MSYRLGATQQTLPFTGFTLRPSVSRWMRRGMRSSPTQGANTCARAAGRWVGAALPFSGLSDPEAVAVDGAGDVFAAEDRPQGLVVELPASGDAADAAVQRAEQP